MKPEVEPRYFVEAAAKTLDILESFNDPQEELSIAEIVRRAGMTYCSTFRLLYTLEKRGYVMRAAGSKRYRLAPARRRFRVGYAALDHRCPYSEEISRSLALAARAAGIDLVVRDNGFSPAKAITNVDSLIDDRVHLAIVHQSHDCAAGTIAARCREAKVPLIAVDHPHPGAYYFGVDNHLAGRLCGEHLRNSAAGKGKLLILVPAPMSEVRKQFVRGLAEGVRWDHGANMVVIDGWPLDAYRWVKQVLKEAGAPAERLRIVAGSDALVTAAIRALASLDCDPKTAIVGLGGSMDAITRMRRTDSRWAAMVTCFPETYGVRLMSMAMRLLEGEPLAPVCHTEHVLLTGANLNDYYPDTRSPRSHQVPSIERLLFDDRIPAALWASPVPDRRPYNR